MQQSMQAVDGGGVMGGTMAASMAASGIGGGVASASNVIVAIELSLPLIPIPSYEGCDELFNEIEARERAVQVPCSLAPIPALQPCP